MAKPNFFPLDRELQNHWLWKDKPFAKGQAWIDMLMLANYVDKKKEHRGQIIICKRGDVNLSMLELSKRWGWSRGKTERFLKLLESDGMVKLNATRSRTTITIENYEKYQGECATGKASNEQQTDNGQTTDGQGTDITKKEKKEKKVKKEKNVIYAAYGEFENVNLSEEELEKLKGRFPYDWQERIERLSSYMQSKGKRYKSHYATILNWARKDEQNRTGGTDFLDL